jgi:hypothetical protein
VSKASFTPFTSIQSGSLRGTFFFPLIPVAFLGRMTFSSSSPFGKVPLRIILTLNYITGSDKAFPGSTESGYHFNEFTLPSAQKKIQKEPMKKCKVLSNFRLFFLRKLVYRKFVPCVFDKLSQAMIVPTLLPRSVHKMPNII